MGSLLRKVAPPPAPCGQWMAELAFPRAVANCGRGGVGAPEPKPIVDVPPSGHLDWRKDHGNRAARKKGFSAKDADVPSRYWMAFSHEKRRPVSRPLTDNRLAAAWVRGKAAGAGAKKRTILARDHPACQRRLWGCLTDPRVSKSAARLVEDRLFQTSISAFRKIER